MAVASGDESSATVGRTGRTENVGPHGMIPMRLSLVRNDKSGYVYPLFAKRIYL